MEKILCPHEAPPTSNRPNNTGDVPMATSSAESLAPPIFEEVAERTNGQRVCHIRENLPTVVPIETNERALEDIFVNLIILSKEAAKKMAAGFVLNVNYNSIATGQIMDKYLKGFLTRRRILY